MHTSSLQQTSSPSGQRQLLYVKWRKRTWQTLSEHISSTGMVYQDILSLTMVRHLLIDWWKICVTNLGSLSTSPPCTTLPQMAWQKLSTRHSAACSAKWWRNQKETGMKDLEKLYGHIGLLSRHQRKQRRKPLSMELRQYYLWSWRSHPCASLSKKAS